MTIYTKQNLDNDEKKVKSVLDVEVQVKQPPTPPSPTPHATHMRLADLRINRIVRRERRRRLCLQFFLLFGILLGLSITLLGTLYLYKGNTRKSYSGLCGVKYTPKHSALNGTSNAGVPSTEPSTTTTKYLYVDERVNIDGDVETLEVPQFDDNDQAVFVHDFAREVTLIRDDTDEACYILPLDTEKIPPPRTFLDLIEGFTSGLYVPVAEEVQANYRLTLPALENAFVAAEYGETIASQCVDYDTYRLIEVTEEEMATTTTTTTMNVLDAWLKHYGMYAGGNFIIRYNLHIS